MTRWVAEIGSNHNRDEERSLQLVEASAAAGCTDVKVQAFRVEDLFAPEALRARPELLDRRAWELPLDLVPVLRDRCAALGIGFGATPFGLWAVDALEPHVDFFKIASYELLWHDLIRACAQTGKPLVMSTGMATVDEIGRACDAARAAGCRDLTLLHCVSGYPTPEREANLAAIETLRRAFGVPVGWSDHTGSAAVVRRAVSVWGAVLVELHVDLDGAGFEAGGHCWRPGAVRELVHGSDTGADASAADGDGVKAPSPAELPDVPWRADPSDGLRPLRGTREGLSSG